MKGSPESSFDKRFFFAFAGDIEKSKNPGNSSKRRWPGNVARCGTWSRIEAIEFKRWILKISIAGSKYMWQFPQDTEWTGLIGKLQYMSHREYWKKWKLVFGVQTGASWISRTQIDLLDMNIHMSGSKNTTDWQKYVVLESPHKFKLLYNLIYIYTHTYFRFHQCFSSIIRTHSILKISITVFDKGPGPG